MDDHKHIMHSKLGENYVGGENELTNKVSASITVRETVKLKNVTFTLA